MVRRVVLFTIVLQCIAIASNAQWLNAQSDDPDDGAQHYLDWFYQLRTRGSGPIPDGAYQRATAVRDALANRYKGKFSVQSVQSNPVNWTNIGPYNISTGFGGPHGGRINTIAINPNNAKTAYFGGANGGVWKTTNGGTSWKPKSDFAPALAMGAIAIDPQSPNIIYAGTGEYVRGSGSFFGAGMLKSTDAGETWQPSGLANVGAFSKMVIHPTKTNIIFAGGAGSGGGLYRSTDAGASWMKIPASSGLPPGDVTDVDLSVSENVYVLYVGIPGHGIYRSADGGDTWAPVHNYLQMRRMHVAANPQNPNDVVDLSIRYDGGFEGCSRSLDGGQTWTDISGNFQSNDPFGVAGTYQGWYDAYLIRDPKTADRFLMAGISIWLTEDGGASWTDVGGAYAGGIHPDQHAAAFSSTTNDLIAGCDGGIASSTDRGASYNVLNDSTAITESYGMAIDQTVDDITYIGTQDNGTLTGSRDGDWGVIGGGDGSTVVVDSRDNNKIYFMRPTAFAVSLYTASSGEQDFSSGINSGDSVGWVKPLIQDETNHILYTASQFLYVLGSGSSTWARRSKKLASGSGSYINAIGPAGDGSSVMIGTTDGLIWTTTNNGLNFTQGGKLPGRAVTDIKVSPASKQTFYVTLSGFGRGHVFKTTDFGTTFTDISSQLPDISCNKILLDPAHPAHLYVGTDVGMFYSPDDGVDWLPYGASLPNVAILDMAMQVKNRVIRTATHGRSVWEAPMDDIPSGITSPTVASIWYIGEPTAISWYGTTSNAVKVEISTDDAGTWTTLSPNASGNSFAINSVKFAESQRALVRVTDGSEILLSQHFQITRRLAGSTLLTFSEQPLYMYDLAYDGDDNTLFVTNFTTGTTGDQKIYKMDPNNGNITGSITVNGSGGFFTGIKYDPTTKHLFVHQSRQDNNTSHIFEITTAGVIMHQWSSPCSYGTGILVIGDTLFLADRDHNVIHRVQKTNPATSIDDFDLTQSGRVAAFGPRCLALNSMTGDLYHTWTDFQGTASNATLYDSYILKLSRTDGLELSSWFVQEGGNNGTNVRGIEYDPRSNGTQVWVTVLNSGNSAKVIKITLVDGQAGTAASSSTTVDGNKISVYPNPLQENTTVSYTLASFGSTHIVVRDMLGREVASSNYENENVGDHAHRISLGGLASGSYNVAIYAGQALIGVRMIAVY